MNDSPGCLSASFAVICREAFLWPTPGSGATRHRFDLLRDVSRADLVLGRLVEAHADAVAIANELGYHEMREQDRWGVWAAGAANAVVATPGGGGWRLTGTRPWCSAASLVDHALVTAAADDGPRLFAVCMDAPEVVVLEASWAGPGMARSDTRSVCFDAVLAAPVGGPGAYLDRPGFWAGAIGVAACWHGGTLTIAEPILTHAREHHEPHLLAHLGAVHTALVENQSVLNAASVSIDNRPLGPHAARALATRATVERNAVEVANRVGRALGPGPLAQDSRHAATVTDLSVYVRQHHAERDLEKLGRLVAGTEDDPWA